MARFRRSIAPGKRCECCRRRRLLNTEQLNLKTKLAYDITPWLRATYTIGFWSNDSRSNIDTYLRDGAGNPTYGGVSALCEQQLHLV